MHCTEIFMYVLLHIQDAANKQKGKDLVLDGLIVKYGTTKSRAKELGENHRTEI